MKRMCLFILLCLCLFDRMYSEAAVAPFITRCRTADADCHKKTAISMVPLLATGVPALGLNAIDPMTVERVLANQAGLLMDFRNTVVKGLRNCQVLGLNRQPGKIFLEVRCSVTLVGDYTLGGKLLIMPIEGTGKYKIKIRDIVAKVELSISETNVDGQNYWKLTNKKYSTDVQTNVEFQFQNLFNGNKQLSDAVHQFANSNWKDIFREVAPPIIKAIFDKIVGEVVKIFKKVPISELSLD